MHTAKATIAINAPASRVWDVLTRPELIREYLFGTETVTDWKVGSPITFRGEWEGKSYEDKGTILAFDPLRKLAYSYWSSMSGTEDKPENYAVVTHLLEEEAGKTTLGIIQDNIRSEETRAHSENNWNAVLKGIREIAER